MSALEEAVAGFEPAIGLARLKELSRLFARASHEERAERLKRPLRLAVLANHSTQFLVQGLELALASRGFSPVVYEAPYNQWELELADPKAPFLAHGPDAVLLTLSAALLAYRADAADPIALAGRVCGLVLEAKQRTRAMFVVALAEPLQEEIDATGWAARWRRAFNEELRTRLEGSCTLVDMDPLVTQVGAGAWYAGRFLVAAKFCCHPDRTASLADYLASHVAAALARAVKLVIVDLDNTLWGGVVGEAGWQGVELDAEGGGYPYLRLQKFLLGLHEKGVLLAAASKNNAEEALAVFRNRPEMLLKEDHFAAMRIDWNPKSANVAAILEELNLSSAGVVFLDDSPHEREEVRRLLPEIWVPDFPQDNVDLAPMLAASGRFRLPLATREDLERNAAYRLERRRRQAQTSFADLGEYYRSLELVLTPVPIGPDNEKRVLDLIAKTNQFNLTTRRHGADALARFCGNVDNYCYAYSLRDRFGHYGLVAVLIAERRGDACVIDTWLMSCRVMGRTVERAVFEHLRSWAVSHGIKEIIGEYILTAKNAPVRGLYSQLGFADMNGRHADPQVKRYRFDLKTAAAENLYVRVES